MGFKVEGAWSTEAGAGHGTAMIWGRLQLNVTFPDTEYLDVKSLSICFMINLYLKRDVKS